MLSAYEKNDAAASSSDIETASSDLGNGTAAPQSTVSERKGSKKNPNTQISEEENAEKMQNSAENAKNEVQTAENNESR